jgi:AraC-like DNA-binding protein
MIETIAPGTTIVGLRFRPAAAASWLRVPMWELVNRRVALEELWGSRARAMADFIGDARTSREAASRLQRGLCDVAKSIAPPPPDPRMKALFSSLASLASLAAARPMHRDVTRIAHRLGIAERTLRRHCQHTFGYGPKTLERILRFQRFLTFSRSVSASALASHGAIGLADCAAEAGYADQAHLSREVRALCGQSPTMILNDRAAAIV